jgi:hypothetical protein
MPSKRGSRVARNYGALEPVFECLVLGPVWRADWATGRSRTCTFMRIYAAFDFGAQKRAAASTEGECKMQSFERTASLIAADSTAIAPTDDKANPIQAGSRSTVESNNL